MEIEKQVCPLEYSKKLKELGVTRESFFGWFWHPYDAWVIYPKNENMLGMAAYTVSELGEMIPSKINVKNHNGYEYEIKFYKEDELWNSHAFGWCIFRTKNEIDSRAEMLIYLIENGHVKAEDLNN